MKSKDWNNLDTQHMTGVAIIKMAYRIYLAQLKEEKQHFEKELKSSMKIFNLKINKNISMNCPKSKKNIHLPILISNQYKMSKKIKLMKKISL